MRVPTRHHATSVLLYGLVVGVIGSFSDNLLGGSTVALVIQLVLWAASAVLLAAALVGLARGDGADAPVRHGSRATPAR